MDRLVLIRRLRLPLPLIVVLSVGAFVFVPLALLTVVPAILLLFFSLVAGVGLVLSSWAVVELLAFIERWMERDGRFRL
jgi:protein-S-isoprenylcysteine O-methyltransferase Ste14